MLTAPNLYNTSFPYSIIHTYGWWKRVVIWVCSMTWERPALWRPTLVCNYTTYARLCTLHQDKRQDSEQWIAILLFWSIHVSNFQCAVVLVPIVLMQDKHMHTVVWLRTTYYSSFHRVCPAIVCHDENVFFNCEDESGSSQHYGSQTRYVSTLPRMHTCLPCIMTTARKRSGKSWQMDWSNEQRIYCVIYAIYAISYYIFFMRWS
jgi:hypothetical protein